MKGDSSFLPYGFTGHEKRGLHATVLALKLHGSVIWWAVLFWGGSHRDPGIIVSSGSDTKRIAEEFGKHGFPRVQAIERRFEEWDWTLKEDGAG